MRPQLSGRWESAPKPEHPWCRNSSSPMQRCRSPIPDLINLHQTIRQCRNATPQTSPTSQPRPTATAAPPPHSRHTPPPSEPYSRTPSAPAHPPPPATAAANAPDPEHHPCIRLNQRLIRPRGFTIPPIYIAHTISHRHRTAPKRQQYTFHLIKI